MNDITSIIEDCYKSDIVSDRVIKKVIEIIGQKEWQILHDENNDICTTMGEMIITLDRITDLEKENAKLKCECRRCVYTDRLCIPSDFGKDRNGICDHFKDVFDENAELKEKLKIEQNARGDWFGKAVTKDRRLNEAKEIIKDLLSLCEGETDSKLVFTRAEQFLKENSVSEHIQRATHNYVG